VTGDQQAPKTWRGTLLCSRVARQLAQEAIIEVQHR
jgi:hypothetical protein